MKNRIDSVVEIGKIPKEVRDHHKGFLEWSSKVVTKLDHQSIVQVIHHLNKWFSLSRTFLN